MATTLTVQNSINFAQPILKNQPLMVSNMEPALSAANMILQIILGPPFKWRFNRNTFNFAITEAGGTDYPTALTDFGFLECQWLKDASGNIYQLNGAVALAIDGNQSRPVDIETEFDDNAGNITFRMKPAPDQNYTVYGDYQKKATLITSPAATWGVVPDEFSYIFNEGFLCRMSLLINDSRFPIFESYFISHLLSAQDGLTDVERNIFLANWTAAQQTLQRAQNATATGGAGRAK
jgi:hypothetical protein